MGKGSATPVSTRDSRTFFKHRSGPNTVIADWDNTACKFKAPIVTATTITTLATAGAATYTIAQLLGGLILRDPAGAARSDVLPTAALIVAGIPQYQIGMAIPFTIRNTADAAGEVITVTAGTGGSTSGTMTIPVGASRSFLLRITAATTYTIYSVSPDVPSVPTGSVLAVTDADGLTVGGVIVPQEMVIVVNLQSHASLKTRNLFYASAVAWTVTAIVYEPEVAEGTGSVVCTVCKVTGNNVAVAATTPMCTAFAVTGTAGTPVVATLTSTGADLALAATNKIGCIFTGGDEFLDSGSGRLYIKMKRS